MEERLLELSTNESGEQPQNLPTLSEEKRGGLKRKFRIMLPNYEQNIPTLTFFHKSKFSTQKVDFVNRQPKLMPNNFVPDNLDCPRLSPLLPLSDIATFSSMGRKFYGNLTSEMWAKNPEIIYHYPSHRAIPNILKTCNSSRTMTMLKPANGDSINLNDVVASPQEYTLVHVAKERAALEVTHNITKISKLYELPPRTTWTFRKEQLETFTHIIRPFNVYMVLGVEQIFPEPKCLLSLAPAQRPVYTLPELLIHKLQSGLSIRWSQIHRKTKHVILASRFAVAKDHSHVPLQIVLLEAGGKTLFNSFICPRMPIRNYQTPQHGLTEEMVTNAIDHYEAYNTICEILKKCIVIGMDPYHQLDKLELDLLEITGVRNLQTSNVFRWSEDASEETLNRPVKWKLEYLLPGIGDYRNAYKEAVAINSLYYQYKSVWPEEYFELVELGTRKKEGDTTKYMENITKSPGVVLDDSEDDVTLELVRNEDEGSIMIVDKTQGTQTP